MSKSARNKAVEPHTEGELREWGGIVSGRVTAWAEALDVPAETIVRVVDRAGIELLTDTAREKSGNYDRPTDPELRCLAMGRDEAERLRSLCDKADPAGPGQDSNSPAVAITVRDPNEPMNGTKSEDLRVRVTPDTYERVENAAKREDRTVSGWVRQWMRRGLEHALEGESGTGERQSDGREPVFSG